MNVTLQGVAGAPNGALTGSGLASVHRRRRCFRLLEHGFLQRPCSLSLCIFHQVRVRIQRDPRAAVSEPLLRGLHIAARVLVRNAAAGVPKQVHSVRVLFGPSARPACQAHHAAPREVDQG